MTPVKDQSFFYALTPTQVAHCIALSDVDDIGLVKVLRTEYRESREDAALSRLCEFSILKYERNKVFGWSSDVVKETFDLIEEWKKPMTLADITPEHLRASNNAERWNKEWRKKN